MIGRAPQYVVYVVVDKSKTPPTPLTIRLTRQLCREFKEKQPNAAELRIRRAKLTLFDS
jgi:hypothetical protein